MVNNLDIPFYNTQLVYASIKQLEFKIVLKQVK